MFSFRFLKQIYTTSLKNRIFGFAKASGLNNRKRVHISNIDLFTIVQSRKHSLKPKTDFSITLGIMGVLGITAFGSIAQADVPIGIVGGGNQLDLISSVPYAGLIFSSGTVVFPVSNLPGSGSIGLGFPDVAINNSGQSIIGGVVDTSLGNGAPYAARVPPSGNASSSLSDLPLLGYIGYSGRGVAINNSGQCLIGGYDVSIESPCYAAFVDSDSLATFLLPNLPSTGFITSVAINDSGIGLIGGTNSDTNAPYAARVLAKNNVVTLNDLPTLGIINCTAINNSGDGIIGGYSNSSPSVTYAARVTNNDASELSNLPTTGAIYAVSINNTGTCIIGGVDNETTPDSNVPYAALVSPGSAIASRVDGLPSLGIIYSTSINISGACIIGGYIENGSSIIPYAAFLSSIDDIQPILNLPSSGGIISVSINSSGAALIGGVDQSSGSDIPYVAFVAPNGTPTRFSGMPAGITIFGVALSGEASFPNPSNLITLQSIGPYSSAINSQSAAINTLTNHFTMKSQMRNDSLTSSAVAELDSFDQPMKCAILSKDPKNSLWMEPFGNYLHLRAEGEIPTFTNAIGGVLAGYDYNYSSTLMLGSGLGYAYNHIDCADGIEHGNLQEELACLYTAYQKKCFRLNAVLWGGIYQFSNHRHSFHLIASKAHIHGWILSSHLELAFPRTREKDCYHLTLEPFIMCDYINSWQNHYTETGRSGFNLVMPNQYAALLQTEAGLRFFEEWINDRFTWLLEEKLSYINQVPLHVQNTSTYFVQSISTFPVAIGSSNVQNLGGVGVSGMIIPKNRSYPNVGIDFAAALAPSYQSYYAGLSLTKRF